MRPVQRGACPQDADGNDVAFTEYMQARRALIERLGECCSYCEMQLDASLAVEHVQPKKPPGAAAALPERELAWGNFLLGCTNCNSIKSFKTKYNNTNFTSFYLNCILSFKWVRVH